NKVKIFVANRFSVKNIQIIENCIDITDKFKEIFHENLIIFCPKDHFDSLINNQTLYNIVLEYINKFLISLKKRINVEKNKEVKVGDVLDYFKKNISVAKSYKDILDEELVYIKQHRPDIVASWKYYQEFEKMCEELDENN
ncbi:DUF2972 domain-containing protein, partial [Campylobacter jejuni]|nr:DUF2972 domain-containing protein [Campylobacter jejuni]EJC1870664.1 DUF2972 domain-containing protein [Campylobacter jejuni]EKM1534219.1 DUF2972 domain-containing protein [Campylobacter jejuni]